MTNVMVLGPCVAESIDLMREVTEHLLDIWDRVDGLPDLFIKGSFDKANRTAIDGARGPGFKRGVEIFSILKQEYPGVKWATDIHEPWQAKEIGNGFIDCLQIPAFLCKQTDLLVAAGEYSNVVNVKKGQWVAPATCAEMPGKVRAAAPDREVWLCERGTVLGYHQLVVDFRAARSMKPHFNEMILDCTHATQYVANGRSLGDPDLAARYFLAAPIFGYSGVFAEIHPDPMSSPSDSTSMLHMNQIETLIKKHMDILSNL